MKSLTQITFYKTCVLCTKLFEGLGSNPSPLSEVGECCKVCDDTIVLNARLDAMFGGK